MKQNALEIENLKVNYGTLEAVSDVSFGLTSGSIAALLGANGSGKSTILKAISGVKRPAGGQIWFQGTRIDGRPPYQTIGDGIVHVLERRGLFPHMSVLENLIMGAYSRKRLEKHELNNDLEGIYQHFPVLKDKRKNRAGNLSGGEAEQLAIARALMARPQLLLLDEPLQGIAPNVISEIANIIVELNETGLTILMVEHNISVSFELSQWIYILERGKLILQGKPKELSDTAYVQEYYLGVK